MNAILQTGDFAALSPLWILLVAALTLLVLETFAEQFAKKGAFYITCAACLLALIGSIVAPPSENPLFTRWLIFDSMARLFTIFFLSIGLISTFLSASFFQRVKASPSEYYFLLISAIFGLILIGIAADFLILFLGLETLSIALYVLCCYIKKWEISAEASIKYFFTGAVATAFLLYGIALIYGAIGTTHFADLMHNYPSLLGSSHQALFLGGIAFITIGLGFKAAIFPFIPGRPTFTMEPLIPLPPLWQ